MADHADIDHTGLTGVGGTETLPATIIDAKGDLIAGSAADTPAKLTAGANDTILMADSGQTTGLKWVASQTPSTQAFGDSAAEGTADTYARGDHKHAMPANPAALTLISDTVLGSDTASFDLTSIPGTYKHLLIEYQMRSDRAANNADSIGMRFNNDSSSIYDYSSAQHDGSSAFYSRAAANGSFAQVAEVAAASATAGMAGAGTIRIQNYTGTAWQKSYRCVATCAFGTTAGNVRIWDTGGNWRSTAAITRVTLFPINGSNFKTGSRVTLYGLG